MKVSELIKQLEEMPQDAEIYIKTWSSEYKKDIEVKENLNGKITITEI